jgi:hypothetical protein
MSARRKWTATMSIDQRDGASVHTPNPGEDRPCALSKRDTKPHQLEAAIAEVTELVERYPALMVPAASVTVHKTTRRGTKPSRTIWLERDFFTGALKVTDVR